jgi:hypothetical protein
MAPSPQTKNKPSSGKKTAEGPSKIPPSSSVMEKKHPVPKTIAQKHAANKPSSVRVDAPKIQTAKQTKPVHKGNVNPNSNPAPKQTAPPNAAKMIPFASAPTIATATQAKRAIRPQGNVSPSKNAPKIATAHPIILVTLQQVVVLSKPAQTKTARTLVAKMIPSAMTQPKAH